MIKNILWDFDGVILDSMKIKGDGFLELFSSYSQDNLDKIIKYHFTHGGVSRFDKIRHFYNDILKQDINEDTVMELANEFGNIVSKSLLNKSNLIEDSFTFIKYNFEKYNFHIVSGAEDTELNYLCKELELKQYFISIAGSPTKKDILVKNIMEKYNYNAKETILIGDAVTDYNAANKNRISFYGYNNNALRNNNYIESFKSVDFG